MRAVSLAGVVLFLVLLGAGDALGLNRVERAKAIARSTWPDSPCLYAERVAFHSFGDGQTLGDADASRCQVRVSAGLDDYTFCTVMVHEFGHLAGLEHADMDQTDIMYPIANVVFFPPCLPGARVPRLTGYPHMKVASARRAVRRREHRAVTCERETATEVRCRARRYYVVRLRNGAVLVRRVPRDEW